MDVTHPIGLSNLFAEYFEIVPANTNELINEVFRLRHEVYCDCCLLDKSQHPDALERDRYDSSAAHSLLYHRPSGECAGAVRVILPNPDDSGWLFQTERVAAPFFDRSLFDPTTIPRHAIGEVSKFCLSSKFRLRQNDKHLPYGPANLNQVPPAPDERRKFPHTMLGLLTAAFRISWENNLSFWYALMEPCLERRLKQFGVVFQPISMSFEHCGHRRAYLAYLPHMFEEMRKTHPDIWDLFTGSGVISFTPDGCERFLPKNTNTNSTAIAC